MNRDRDKIVSTLQTHLKSASLTILDIEELLKHQEHIIQQQAKEIEALKKRVKELEALELQSGQVEHLKSLQVQLKNQIEFMKFELEEKDNIILGLQTGQKQQAQQHHVQVSELQTQLRNRDSQIDQLKKSDFGSLLNQLPVNSSGVLGELHLYPEALQKLAARISQEFEKLQSQLAQKEQELENLRASKGEPLDPSKLQKQIKVLKDQSKAEDKLLDDLAKEVNQKKAKVFQMKQQFGQLANEEAALKQLQEKEAQIQHLQSQLANKESMNDQIRKSFKLDQGKLDRTDDLVNQNLQLDDLIRELEAKIVRKRDQQLQLQEELVVVEAEGEQLIQKERMIVEATKAKLKAQLDSLNQEVEKLRQEIKTQEDERQTLKGQLQQARQGQQEQNAPQELLYMKTELQQVYGEHGHMLFESAPIQSSQSLTSPTFNQVDYGPKQLQEIIRQQKQQIEFLNFEIAEKDKLLNAVESPEVKDLAAQNKLVDNRIQELRAQLEYRNKRKEQLEQIVSASEDSFKKPSSNAALLELQDQLHQKNLTIVQLHDEIASLQKKMHEIQQELSAREMEMKFNELMRNNVIQCEKADDLVKQNIAMDNLIFELEKKLVEKESRMKELEYLKAEPDLSGRDSQIMIKSFDAEQDQYQQPVNQPSLLEGLKFEVQEKDKMIEQLNSQITQLKRSNYNHQIRATADPIVVQNLSKENQALQQQADNLVQQNLILQDIIHDLEFKLTDKKDRQKALDEELAAADQVMRDKQDEVLRKNMEVDSNIQQLEKRLNEKNSQTYQMQQRLSQHKITQPLQVFQEASDSRPILEVGEGNPIIAEHQTNLNELSSQITSLTEQVRLLSQDDAEIELLQQQRQEKSARIEQLKLFLQSTDDIISVMEGEQQEKANHAEKLKLENHEIEKIVLELQSRQQNLIQEAVQKGSEEGIDVQQLIAENLSRTQQLHELQQRQKQLKAQIGNLESVIIDLQMLVRERQDELARVSSDNQQIAIIVRKQKQKRDALFKEQLPLAEKVGLLEQQVSELTQETARLQPQLIQLYQQVEQMNEVRRTKEQQIETFESDKALTEQRIEALKSELHERQVLEKQLSEEVAQFKESNRSLEQEVQIYTELKKESANINNKIQQVTDQINEERQLLEVLKQELAMNQEQVQLMRPQSEQIKQLYQQTKATYDQCVQQLSDLQVEFQKVTDQKNQIEQEANYLKLYAEDQEKQIKELQASRIILEERIRLEQSMKNAIDDRADRIATQLEQMKSDISKQNSILDQLKRERDDKIQQIKKLQNEVQQQKQKCEQLHDLQLTQASQIEKANQLQSDIEKSVRQIYEREAELVELSASIQAKDVKVADQKKRANDLEQELEFYVKQEAEWKERILQQDRLLLGLENEFHQKQGRMADMNEELKSIHLEDIEEQLQEQRAKLKQQQGIRTEIEELKERLAELERQREEARKEQAEKEQQLGAQKESQLELEKRLQSGAGEIFELKAKVDEMNFQISEKQNGLESLNEIFKKLDEESKIMDGVISLKERELSNLKQRKEQLLKSLGEGGAELAEVQKSVAHKKKFHQPVTIQEEEPQDELQEKLSQLTSRKANILEDLHKLVQQSPEPQEKTREKEHDLSLHQEQAQQLLRDREKRIEILEQTIQLLQQQNQERQSVIPSMFQSKISVQPSFLYDDDPLLLELQDKFTKESDLLLDLQTKLKQTAERHHDLAMKLQEWAEKECRLANELEVRRQSVEKIEQDLQAISVKQFDLESEKVNVLQRIYQLELETQEILESETSTKLKLKEKKEYVQSLIKNMVEMDHQLLQLRNKMANYSKEGRQLAEQLEGLEAEKEGRLHSVQSLQEELEALEMERQDKEATLERIRKEISDGQKEQERLESQYGAMHGRNAQLKGRIGMEEALYKRLQQELEGARKRQQLKYENLFSDGECQTNYEVDQIEGLVQQLAIQKITKEETRQLKQACRDKLEGLLGGAEQLLNENQTLKQVIQMQQILITVQESENGVLVDSQQRKQQKASESTKWSYNLEWLDLILNKSKPAAVEVDDHQVKVNEQLIARQWIVGKSFDYDNSIYPLGVLHIVYKVSLYQVVTLSLTGTKIIQLYQNI